MTPRTDPARLASSDDVPASLREALRDASGDGPSASDVQAITAGLGPALGAGSGPSGTGGLSGAAAGKIAAIVGAAALVAGGLVWTGRTSEPIPPPADMEATAPAVASSEIPVPSPTAAHTEQGESEEPEEVTAPPEPTVSAPVPAPRHPTKAESKPIAPPAPASSARPVAKPSEAALLDAARKALTQDPNRTLAYAQQHRTLYPDGILAQEREVLVVEALRRLGRLDDAKKHDDDFRSRYPSSMHGRDIPVPSTNGKKN